MARGLHFLRCLHRKCQVHSAVCILSGRIAVLNSRIAHDWLEPIQPILHSVTCEGLAASLPYPGSFRDQSSSPRTVISHIA